jgi:hypothetical protein
VGNNVLLTEYKKLFCYKIEKFAINIIIKKSSIKYNGGDSEVDDNEVSDSEIEKKYLIL